MRRCRRHVTLTLDTCCMMWRALTSFVMFVMFECASAEPLLFIALKNVSQRSGPAAGGGGGGPPVVPAAAAMTTSTCASRAARDGIVGSFKWVHNKSDSDLWRWYVLFGGGLRGLGLLTATCCQRSPGVGVRCESGMVLKPGGC